MTRLGAVLVGLALALTACTGAPTPTPTDSPTGTTPATSLDGDQPGRVAVVVSPDLPAAAEAVEDGARSVVAGLLGDTELRVVTADDRGFVEDLLGFFTTEGYDLVCAVGPGAAEATRRVARTSPSTRFCAAPALPDGMPQNVLAIDVRMEEVGWVAGRALALDDPAGVVGLATSGMTWAPDRLQAGLAAGLQAGGVAEPAIASVAVTDDVDAVVEQVLSLLGEGVGAFVTLAGTVDADVLATIDMVPVAEPTTDGTESPEEDEGTESPSPRFPSLVAGPEARPTNEDAVVSDQLLVVVELHLAEAIALAVGRHVGDWDTSPASLGFAEDVFRVVLGEGDRAQAVRPVVDEAVAAIRAGDVQPMP